LTLQNLPQLKALAPNVYKEAKFKAAAAHEPVALDYGNSTLETFAVRTMAHLVSYGSVTIGGFQAALGIDNSAMMSQWDDAQSILKNTGYDTKDGGVLASVAQSMDGVIGAFSTLSTDFMGILVKDVALVEELRTGEKRPVPTPTEFLQLLATNPSLGEVINYITVATVMYHPLILGAQTVYNMSSALIMGNYAQARNSAFDLLTLGLLGKWADTPAGKRKMQLAVKQADFARQQMTRGVIDTSPLKNMVYEHNGSKSYIVEQPRVAADGTPISSGRIIKAEDYSQAARGIARLNEKGEVVYQACFAAGTIVHTEQGPLPIEKVRVGTQVLSQPENGGEIAYKRVVNTVAHLDQQVHAVQVKVQGSDELTTLITTPNHPFWVQTPLAHGQHWLAAEHLEPGFILQIADGRIATVYANGLIRQTQHTHIGFAADDRVGVGVGMMLDLSNPKHIHLIAPQQPSELGTLELGEPYLTPVYNFEVEEFHTYYVGDSAVWVHNTNCAKEGAVDAVFEKAAIEGECFSGDTYVVVEPWTDNFNGGVSTNMLYIERIEVGDTVLSRCETTGEMAYKQVTKVFAHGWTTTSDIAFECGPEFRQKFPASNNPSITTTANHPFWVQGKGWTKVCDLQPDDEMLTYNGLKATVKHVSLNNREEEVYNLEVEDFHTYFVESSGIWVHNKSPLKFDRLNPNAVPDPKPQWTPQHKSEAALIERKTTLEQRKGELDAITTKTPPEIKEFKDVNRELTGTNTALREIQPRKALSAAGIEMTMLPDKNAIDLSVNKTLKNDLGRTDIFPDKPGYPDGVLTSTRYPDLNGVVADIYQPELKGSLGNTLKTIKGKSEKQSSVVVVDLRDAPPPASR
jgi:hypothetical protein